MMELSYSCVLSTVLLLVALIDGSNGQNQRTATCSVASGSGTGQVSGTVDFSQPMSGGNVTIVIKLTGLVEGDHGFHVHTVASLGNNCSDAAGHLNIDGTLHGAPNDTAGNRHTGDLGNIVADASGKVDATITDWLISLTGPTSIIGKPIVIHELRDDLGRGGAASSNTTGNAGARLGCCLIQDTTGGPGGVDQTTVSGAEKSTVGAAGLTTFSPTTLLLAGIAWILLKN